MTIVITVIVTILLIALIRNFATPERQLKQKVEHRYAIGDEQYPREMSALLGPPLIDGNSISILQNGDEIFPAMLAAIRAAKTTISFETFIYWKGDIGSAFAAAFEERAKAGVEVNVLLDWVGSDRIDPRMLAQIEAAGVRVHRYRPLRWYNIGRMNNRTHRKLLIVDGKVGFTGGVGIADQWTGHAQDPKHWRDLHFRLQGPVVAQLLAAFNDNWIKTTGDVLNGERHFPALQAAGDKLMHLFISSPAGGSENMHLMFLLSIAAAVKSIDIQAAYFVPDELVIKALLAARERGVHIRITLPGQHIDSQAVRLASKATWGVLLYAGIEVYEYQPTMIHNKLFIADGKLVSVGSTNFDYRSFKLNDEASLNVYDEQLANEMTAIYESDLKNTSLYTYERWQQRPLREKFLEKFVLPFKSQM